jgi:tetratricopeptide (TPR) repeat protein
MEDRQNLDEAIRVFRTLNTKFPGFHIYENQLSVALRNKGLYLDDQNRRNDAKAALEEACRYARGPARMPDRPEYKARLARALGDRGELSLDTVRTALRKEGLLNGAELKVARTYLEQAVEPQKAALRLHESARYREYLETVYRNLIRTHVLLAERKEAKRIVENLIEFFGRSPQQSYRNACLLGHCARDAARADRVVLGQYAGVMRFCTSQALELLEEPVSKGFATREKLERDRAFDALRHEPGFLSLVNEAARKQAKSP